MVPNRATHQISLWQDLNRNIFTHLLKAKQIYKEELKNFFNEINKKHPSTKFDQEYSKQKIEFLDVLVYKDEQQKLQTTLFKKNTDRNTA